MKQIVFLSIVIFLTGCSKSHSIYEGLTEDDLLWLTFDFVKFDAYKSSSSVPTYQYTLDNGTIVFMIYQREIYRMTVSHPDSTIYKSYRYHSNGKLSSVDSYYNKGGIPINKGYRYDKKGKLIEIIDYDEPFKYSLEDIFKFLAKENIQNPTIYRTTKGFTKEEDFEEEYKLQGKEILWKIHSRNLKEQVETVFVIDGLTGEVLIREEFKIHI